MVPINMVIAKSIGKMSTKMMEAKDERVKTMSEILSGFKVIKFFVWEDYFQSRVKKHRQQELKFLKWRKYLDALCVYLWATTPVLISISSFTTFVLLGNELTASKVFTSIALFAMLTSPLNAFPWVLNGLVESLVSIKRIGDFLSLKKLDRGAYFSPREEVADVEHENLVDIAIGKGRFSVGAPREGQQQFVLSDINLTLKRGDFVGVIGRVGSGKSSLLGAILGELNKEAGGITVREPVDGIGYVQQEVRRKTLYSSRRHK